jgi:hypothetical protein
MQRVGPRGHPIFMADKTTPNPPKAKTPNRIAHEEDQARKRRIFLDDNVGNVPDGIETRMEGEDVGPDQRITRGKIPKKKKSKKKGS